MSMPVNSPQIVVGTDGSPAADFAVRWAAAHARRHDARLVVVHAWLARWTVSPLGIPGPALDTHADEAAAKQLLEDSITRALGDTRNQGLRIEPIVAHGPAGAVLCEAAENADLLVVGTKGHGRLGGLLIGSVSKHCLREAHSSVAVIPPLDALSRPARIVCGVDGSENALRALNWAVDETDRAHARLVVTTAWTVPTVAAPWAVMTPVWSPYEYRTIAKEALERIVTPVRTPGRDVMQRLEEGSAAGALLRVAKDERADLLVVGSRGHGAMQGLLLGSTSEKVAESGVCPVVVVR